MMAAHKSRKYRPVLEVLEDRTAPASMTYTVLNTNDGGADSLRRCINKANANPGLDIIRFDAALVNTSIVLSC